jgi:cystathionine beta-lyase
MGLTKFEMTTPQLRARRSAKWSQYGDEVIPAWVAEMDFHIAPCVQKAIEKIVNEEDYGYPRRNGLPAGIAVAEAFVERMRDQFGWQTDPDLVLPLADLVQGTYAPLCAYSDPNDGIILQTPAYPPFYDAIKNTGRRLIKQQLIERDGRYQIYLEEL